MAKHLFTSESVTEGHPDKMCDQIADSILDQILGEDPMARVACETTATTGMVMVMGEISTRCYVDIPSIVRSTVREIGYDRAKYGFDADTCAVLTNIDEQSPDIAAGVNHSLEERDGLGEDIGAGDQGMMFGFACNQTDVLMPAPIYWAHRLAKRLTTVRKEDILEFLRPDGKTQVTVEYDGMTPVRSDTVVVSAQHAPDTSNLDIRDGILQEVIKRELPAELLDAKTRYLVNPSGRFVIGGPQGDSGLTGRKIIVDTYGGYGRHGGGAFSGKDPTKVDRSMAYAARWVAKNIVAAGLATVCEVGLSYAIGVAQPISITVWSQGTGVVSDEELSRAVNEIFDLRPNAVINYFQLRRPIYKPLAAYGHFGRVELDVPWERTDRIDQLKAYFKA